MTRLQIFLLILTMISAAAVVSVRHQNRLAFIDLQKQQRQRDDLQAEWSRLMLEKATWTSQNNIADAAGKQLHMTAPSPDRIMTLVIDDGETPAGGEVTQ